MISLVIIRTIELADERLSGERVSVAAEVRGRQDGAGLEMGPIRAALGGVRIPLSTWEEVLARTALEMGYLECLGLAWEERAA